jgi:subtilisin family serine protease
MFLPRYRALYAAVLILIGATLVSLMSLPIVKAAQSSAADQSDRVDVLIAFRNTPDPDDEALVRGAGGRVKHRYHLIRAIATSIPRRAMSALLANPRVAAVEPDVKIFAVDAELDNSWGVKRIGGGSVHANGIRGAGVKVAILDTGIDYTHPDLAANYAGGWDFVNNDADPFDDNKHGTHVAGTIAARDDDAGVVGVAPEATLYALKVLDQNGSGDFSSVIAALQWAVDHGVQITNNSYGSTQDPGSIVQAAFDNAAAAGILHVAAAGNSGTCQGTGESVLFPARYGSVVAVAATDPNDVSPCFSSTGPAVELSAPGVSINSTVPGGGYELLSGTSMASPHVAGAAALVISAGVTDTNGNGRVNDEVRTILDNTAHDLGAAGRDTWYGFGLVDAAAAVAGSAQPAPAVTVAVTTHKSSYTRGVDTSAQVTAVVKDEGGGAILGLQGSAFATTLDGAVAQVNFIETAPGSYTGTLDISGAAPGAHAVAVTATDGRSLSGTGSSPLTVVVPNTVRAKSITYSTSGGADNKRNLVIAVLIVDGAGAPVNGAIVSVIAYRSGLFYGAANGRSGMDGKAIFEARNAPPGCYQTLVAAVLAGTRSWDAATPPNGFCK